MAAVATRVISTAQELSQSLDPEDVDDAIIVEYVLGKSLNVIERQLEELEAQEPSAEDESDANIAEDVRNLAQMIVDLGALIEPLAPMIWENAFDDFVRSLGVVLAASRALRLAGRLGSFLSLSFSSLQTNFKAESTASFAEFLEGKQEKESLLAADFRALKIESILLDALKAETKRAIAAEVATASELPFDTVGLLEALERWIGDSIRSFIHLFIQDEATVATMVTESVSFLRAAFVQKRTGQIFDIIVEFPDSAPSVHDLGASLSQTGAYSAFMDGARAAFERRLLVPGATTEAILQIYVAAINVMKLIDSSGLLVEAISEPVSAYMKKRSDTIRCIVASLTDEAADALGLYAELKDSTTTLQDAIDDASDDETAENSAQWTPEPLTLLSTFGHHQRLRSHDLLSMLVHIYGSRELFVSEYATLLGEKLLAVRDFNAEKEIHNVELLKVKFGENSLAKCEVMLKDLADSKRVNLLIQQAMELQNKVNELKLNKSQAEITAERERTANLSSTLGS